MCMASQAVPKGEPSLGRTIYIHTHTLYVCSLSLTLSVGGRIHSSDDDHWFMWLAGRAALQGSPGHIVGPARYARRRGYIQVHT